jgi:protein pelota
MLNFESCSYAERSGIDELMKNGALEKVLGQERMLQEAKTLEEFMVNVGRDNNLSIYGLEQVKDAANSHSVQKLLVLDALLRKSEEVQQIVETVERFGGKIFIFSSESDYGMRLNGFGGIVAIARF